MPTPALKTTIGKQSSSALSKKVKLSYKEQRELDGMEEQIMMAEADVERLETIFSAPDFFETHGAQSEKLHAELSQIKAELEFYYARWEELEAING